LPEEKDLDWLCRVSALLNLTVADYYERGGTRGYGFQERREKEHEVGVRSEAKEAVDFGLRPSLDHFCGRNAST
jgi:hypothetical protein